jgi:hypothetical protein
LRVSLSLKNSHWKAVSEGMLCSDYSGYLYGKKNVGRGQSGTEVPTMSVTVSQTGNKNWDLGWEQ